MGDRPGGGSAAKEGKEAPEEGRSDRSMPGGGGTVILSAAADGTLLLYRAVCELRRLALN